MLRSGCGFKMLHNCWLAMGDAVYHHLRNGGGTVSSVITYALLLDFNEELEEQQKCKVFQGQMKMIGNV